MSERKKDGAEAEDENKATEPAEPQVPYVSPVAEAQPDAENEEQVAARLEVPAGHTGVVYRGRADVVRIGDVTLRPGQPVAVPSDVLEELLTLPNEKFEIVKE